MKVGVPGENQSLWSKLKLGDASAAGECQGVKRINIREVYRQNTLHANLMADVLTQNIEEDQILKQAAAAPDGACSTVSFCEEI